MKELSCFLALEKARLHHAGFEFKHSDLSLKWLSLTNKHEAISELCELLEDNETHIVL